MIDHTASQQVHVWSDRIRVAVPPGRRVARYEDTGLVCRWRWTDAPRQAFSLSAQRSEGSGEDGSGALASLIVAPGGGAAAGGGGYAARRRFVCRVRSGREPGRRRFFRSGVLAGGGFRDPGRSDTQPHALRPADSQPQGSRRGADGRRETGSRARSSGLQYLAGVLVSFLVFAALDHCAASGRRSAVGWAFHMQNPLIVAVLALVMVAVGLNLLGVFEVNRRRRSPGRQGYPGQGR